MIFLFFTILLNGSLFAAERLVGTAKNQSGEVVYIEKHELQMDEGGLTKFINVKYTKPDGKIFAEMTSDFTKNKTVPETTFEDKRFKSKSTLKIAGLDVEFEEWSDGKKISKKKFPLNDSMVASQGFDNFVKLNRKSLESRPIDMKFGVLARKDFYSLTGYKKNSQTANTNEYGIRASTWVVRLFVNELRVVYDEQSQRIQLFSGLSNILDDAGNSQNVTIEYQWLTDE